MDRIKRIVHRLLFPGTVVVLLCIPAAAVLLAYAFLVAGEESPISYAAYVISAYALTIACTGLVPAIRKARGWLRSNPYASRYLEDIPFRVWISLRVSLTINLLYAAVNAFSGLYYHSVWFGTLAAYYLFLAVMRFLLVRYGRRNNSGAGMAAELKRCRVCGAILILMNMALAGVVILVLHQNRSFQYAGSLIYAMALYTFYTTIMAVIHVIRYRKYQSPVMSAAKAVNLAAALVSMLSLETAMLTQFDNGTTSPFFRQSMIASTGGAVCAIVVGMGISMIAYSTRRLKKLKDMPLEIQNDAGAVPADERKLD